MKCLVQRILTLGPYTRGFHIITGEIVRSLPELESCEHGLLHLHLLHTSASLTINENADPDVRGDLMRYFAHAVPDGADYFRHILEGDDDMSAHIISSLLGQSLTLQVYRGELVLGTWQGIYLGEHRYDGGTRRISALLEGEEA